MCLDTAWQQKGSALKGKRGFFLWEQRERKWNNSRKRTSEWERFLIWELRIWRGFQIILKGSSEIQELFAKFMCPWSFLLCNTPHPRKKTKNQTLQSFGSKIFFIKKQNEIKKKTCCHVVYQVLVGHLSSYMLVIALKRIWTVSKFYCWEAGIQKEDWKGNGFSMMHTRCIS